jgi:anaerobic selenocysteine-containing dehydrogenase
LKAREKGTKIIVIDPHKNSVANIADLWIQPKPGSDLALALGILNVLVNESLGDNDFIERYTVGYGELRKHFQQYPPDRVADATWVPAETITSVARFFASFRPACVQWGNGIDHTPNNFQTARAICLIRAITGNIGLPGGDVQWVSPPVLGKGSAELTLQQKMSAEVRSKRIKGNAEMLPWNFYALPQAVIDTMITGDPYPVKGAYIQGCNVSSSYPNANKVHRALEQLDFIAVSDMFMTPTAALADIVLPVATYLEFDSIIAAPYSLAVSTVQQRTERVHDCHSDYEILRDIAREMGLGEYFWDTEEECLDFLLKPAGITFDEFKTMGILYGSPRYRSGDQKDFPTPSGKVELFSQRLNEWGFDPLPTFRESDEAGGIDFPLLFTSWKSGFFRHSEGKQIPSLRHGHPEPLCVIHPDTALEYGIGNGDMIFIETKKGRIRQKSMIETSVDPRVIGIDYGWWFPEKGQPDLWGWDESNINIITDDQPPYGREMGTPRLRANRCRIYKEA